MPTQIAPTPIVKGEEAKAIYEEAHRKTSEQAKRGAEKLSNKFEKLILETERK